MELVKAALRKMVDAEDTDDDQTTTLTESYFLLLQKGIWLDDFWHCVSRSLPEDERVSEDAFGDLVREFTAYPPPFTCPHAFAGLACDRSVSVYELRDAMVSKAKDTRMERKVNALASYLVDFHEGRCDMPTEDGVFLWPCVASLTSSREHDGDSEGSDDGADEETLELMRELTMHMNCASEDERARSEARGASEDDADTQQDEVEEEGSPERAGEREEEEVVHAEAGRAALESRGATDCRAEVVDEEAAPGRGDSVLEVKVPRPTTVPDGYAVIAVYLQGDQAYGRSGSSIGELPSEWVEGLPPSISARGSGTPLSSLVGEDGRPVSLGSGTMAWCPSTGEWEEVGDLEDRTVLAKYLVQGSDGSNRATAGKKRRIAPVSKAPASAPPKRAKSVEAVSTERGRWASEILSEARSFWQERYPALREASFPQNKAKKYLDSLTKLLQGVSPTRAHYPFVEGWFDRRLCFEAASADFEENCFLDTSDFKSGGDHGFTFGGLKVFFPPDSIRAPSKWVVDEDWEKKGFAVQILGGCP